MQKNPYLNKSCYAFTKFGLFKSRKYEDTFISEWMHYFSIDLFRQTQLVIIIICLVKIVPWADFSLILNKQDMFLLAALALTQIVGMQLHKYSSQPTKQRLIVLIVTFLEHTLLMFLLLDKDLVDIQLWQVLCQIGIILQNTISLTPPHLAIALTLSENLLFKSMMLIRSASNNQTDVECEISYFSHCKWSNLNSISWSSLLSYSTNLTLYSNNLNTVYPLMTIIISILINLKMRKLWIYISSFQQSDKSNTSLARNTVTNTFILDQRLQFIFCSIKAEQFINQFQASSKIKITNFAQIIKSQEKAELIKEKIQEAISLNKDMEVDLWMDYEIGKPKFETKINQIDNQIIEDNELEQLNSAPSKNSNGVLYCMKIGPLIWQNSKCVQIVMEKKTKQSESIQVTEYFMNLLFAGTVENIGQLERDYMKWNNMVQLNVIKTDDLKELSKCIHEYHKQYICIDTLRSLQNEFHEIKVKNENEFDLKANIIQAVELVLVKKISLVNEIKVQFEDSFPSKEVISDDLLFHHMIVSILDLIIQPVEDKSQEKKTATKGFKDQALDSKDMMPRQIPEPVMKKFDFKIDCTLKQVKKNQIFDLQFSFEFVCLPYTESVFSQVFKKVREMDQEQFLQPSDILGQTKEYITLLVVFLKLKRMDCEFDLQKKQEFRHILENPSSQNIKIPPNPLPSERKIPNVELKQQSGQNLSSPKIQNHVSIQNLDSIHSNSNEQSEEVWVLTVTLNVRPVQIHTYVGKYGQMNQNQNRTRSRSGNFSQMQSLGQGFSLDLKKQTKNQIRCPTPLNLSFSRESKNESKQKNCILWHYIDAKDFKKNVYLKQKKCGQKPLFPNQPCARITKLPTNKEIDQSQNLSTPSAHNIQYPSSTSQRLIQYGQPTQVTEGNSTSGSIPSQIPLNPSTSIMPVSLFSKDSNLKCTESLAMIPTCSQQQSQPYSGKLISSSPPSQSQILTLQYSQLSKHSKKLSNTSSTQTPRVYQGSEETINEGVRGRSLSRQPSNIQEEINTSEEEEKKDLFGDQKSFQNLVSNQKIYYASNSASSSRKISEPIQSINSIYCGSNCSIQKIGQNMNGASQQQIGQLNSRLHSLDQIQQIQAQGTSQMRIPSFFISEKLDPMRRDHILNHEKDIFKEDHESIESEEDAEIKNQIHNSIKLFQKQLVKLTSQAFKHVLQTTNLLQGQVSIVEAKDSFNSNEHEDIDINNSTILKQPNACRRSNSGRKSKIIDERHSGPINSQGQHLRRSKLSQQIFQSSPFIEPYNPQSNERDVQSFYAEFPYLNLTNNHLVKNQKPNKLASAEMLYFKDSSQINDQINFNPEDNKEGLCFIENQRRRASCCDSLLYQYEDAIDQEIVSNYLDDKINQSRSKTHRRQWLNDDVYRKKPYSRTDIVLVKTNNQKVVSILKQMSSKKCFSDCKHVRNTFNLINQYQKMMEDGNLFLFILIDFQQQNEKCDIIMSEFVASVNEFQRMGVPKTCIVGLYDLQTQQEFMEKNKTTIDFWTSDFNQNIILEQIENVKSLLTQHLPAPPSLHSQ